MALTKFELKEKAVANFQSALVTVGMVRGRTSGKIPDEPMFWRGFVKNTTQAIFLGFDVTDNLELNAADNETARRAIYINGTLYTRNGFSDPEYQELASKIEKACKAASIVFNFTSESYDASQDSESSISYVNFEAEQRLVIN